MKIYTSYYNNKHIASNIHKVSISRIIPEYCKKDIEYHDLSLAPSIELVNTFKYNDLEESSYTRVYLEEIKSINFEEKYTEYKEMFNNEDVVLLCYEKPDDFCHRHIVAKLFKEEVKEYINHAINNSKDWL